MFFKHACLAGLVFFAAVIAAAAVLSSPAAATEYDGNQGNTNDAALKNWDSDNLRFSGYTSASFRIPSHSYGTSTTARYSHAACGYGGIADGYYQTRTDVNDFPVLDYSTNDFKAWTASDLPCDEFVRAQERMTTEAASNGGYWLDKNGNLRKTPLPNRIGSRPASLRYSTWSEKGVFTYLTRGAAATNLGGKLYYYASNTTPFPITSDTHYHRRLDVFSADAPATDWAIYPSTATLNVVWGQQTNNATGRDLYSTPIYSAASLNSVSKLGKIAATIGGSSLSNAIYLSAPYDAGGAICPSGFHPRGEDSADRIGNTTGRTLSHLTHAEGQIADRYWCRSDLRFLRKFYPYTRPGVALHPQAQSMSATSAFLAYGRVNCFYTANRLTSADPVPGSETTGLKSVGDNAYDCEYPYHPLPLCDPDPDNGSNTDWRAYTKTEIVKANRENLLFGKTAGAACEEDAADPPQQAGFAADACVTASLVIDENRIAGSDAVPGVAASDRTLAVATGRTAWDLDVTSPHPLTASGPRDTTAGTGDPDGCADGSESRADHASAPGDAARKQSPAPSYAASDRDDDAAPPNDADGDIDYSGAVKNMAHRYASRVAENTCAAKLAEAEAELSLLELREDGFAQWLSDYKTAADTNASRYSSYTRTPQQSGSGLAILRFNDIEANKATYAALLATRYTNLSSALAAAKTAYDTATDRTAGSSRAAVITTSSDSGCAAHYDREIARLKTLFSSAETSATGNGAAGIKEEQNAVTQTRLVSPPAVSVTTTVNSYSVPDISAVESRRESRTVCLDEEVFGGCWRAAADGETCMVNGVETSNCPGRTRVEVTVYYTCPGGSYTVSGTVSGRYKTSTRSSSFSATYAAAARGESTSSSCPNFAVQSGATYASGAAAYVRGTPGTASSLPSVASVAAPDTLRALGKVSLLGNYYLSHGDRANLEAAAASDRNTAGNSLSVTAGSAPSGSPQKIEDYQTAYKTAYDTAYSQAEGHMSGTAWDSFDWRYETSTLAWVSYQEDPATTYSASTATPRDGTGCDLITVASDGSVSVEATRLDYETSSYGKGSVYSTRTDAQRTCKIRRTRTPELLLEYQPSRPSGTDASKAATFWHVDYQPTPAAERFKLYDEAEVFAVKVFLADRAPVLCYQPGEALVAHVAAKGIDAVNKAVFRNASGFAGGNKKHCYRHPSTAQLGTPRRPAFAFFDDTAHSAMHSVSVVWQQPNPKIVSKLGSTDHLKMMANTVSLVASSPVAYDDATRTSSFYGTYYTFPTDNSVNSPSGWNITGHPTLTLTSTFTQHQVQAKDAAAKTPSTHTMVFKFIDCVFGIEDVAFVDNIASPYALLSDENGVVPPRWKQTYDRDPHNSPTWYYPAFSTYEGALRLDGRRYSNGDLITYGRNTQGGFAHPSYDLENTAADGIGWGIVYEDKVGKQQPVWAIYAPPVPGDNTLTAIEVCGANNLGTRGRNPMPTATRRIGTPATPPPASGVWSWKTSAWNYQDNPNHSGTITLGEPHPDSCYQSTISNTVC